MERAIHIAWVYPDILNIHGGRGDIMALSKISEKMGLSVEIKKCERLSDDIPFEWADIIYLTSGELKCVPEIVAALERQREELEKFILKGGSLWAVSSSGAILGNGINMLDGSVVKGLGILDMMWKERASVWGDDLWLATDYGFEIMGNQIQIAEVKLGVGQAPFGKTIYGRGNCGDGTEGAKNGNVVFTNCLGPMMIKNPRMAAELLKNAAETAGISGYRMLEDDDMIIEDKSFQLIKKFIEKKMNEQ